MLFVFPLQSVKIRHILIINKKTKLIKQFLIVELHELLVKAKKNDKITFATIKKTPGTPNKNIFPPIPIIKVRSFRIH